MRRSIRDIALCVSLAFTAHAGEGFELSSKAMAVAATADPVDARRAAKAIVTPLSIARNPAPQLPLLAMQEQSHSEGGCKRALCYDESDRRIVYRGARSYMPVFGGLTPESISLRRDRIIFKYSFK